MLALSRNLLRLARGGHSCLGNQSWQALRRELQAAGAGRSGGDFGCSRVRIRGRMLPTSTTLLAMLASVLQAASKRLSQPSRGC